MGPFRRKSYAQYAVAVREVNSKSLSAKTWEFSVDCCFKAESFKTTQSDYSQRFGHPATATSVLWTSVKQFRQTGNLHIAKSVRRSAIVTETRKAEVRGLLSASPHKSLTKLAQQTGMSYCCRGKAVTTLKLFPYKLKVNQQLLSPVSDKQYHYCE
jgi:hypothetical protein